MRLLRRRHPGRSGEPPPAPFVVGVPRSGTTLLRLMLDSHPLVAIPPETHLFARVAKAAARGVDRPAEMVEVMMRSRFWPDFGIDPQDLRAHLEPAQPLTLTTALRAFYRTYADAAGKPRWGEKTPGYVTRMPPIAQALPEARFIHIIRDGRDVALSLSDAHFGPDTAAAAAQRWVDEVSAARRDRAELEHYLEIRYEELVRDPEPVLREVCRFGDLPWDGAMLQYHRRASTRLEEIDRELRAGAKAEPVAARQRTSILARTAQPPQAGRIGRWRTDMSPGDLAAVDAVAGELLVALGYEPADPPAPTGRTAGGRTPTGADG